jgi:Cu(I)/Ag(I) efflux system membrane fusion protein
MKRPILHLLGFSIFGAALLSGAPAGQGKIMYYKSTMIPGQISNKPANDSMGMEMVPVYQDEDKSGSAIKIEAATLQQMNLKTGLVTRGPVRRLIRTVGDVAYDERGLRDITTKYDGWLEKLYVNATWTTVKAGEPLFEIYSPELYNAELNTLVALRTEGAGGGPLTRAARERLGLFDLSADFVADLAKSGRVRHNYIYRAPSEGVVIEKMAVAGRMVKAGERIYRLADLGTVWIDAQIYEEDLAAIAPGQAAEVRSTFAGDRVFRGTVAEVLPQVEAATRTATARLVIANPDGLLRPGTFADVRFEVELAADAVLVPDSAVLRSGERNTVFVALQGGNFEPREVKLGARSDDYRYAVLSGLAAGERVVISGQFLLDSESQLREAIRKIRRGNPPAARSGPGPASMPSARAGDGTSSSGISDLPGMRAGDPGEHGGK